MRVGTKQLKDRLSHYLRLVRAGERVEVTDHGTVVAELRGARAVASGDDECLTSLEREGLVTRGSRKMKDVVPAVARAKRKLVSAIVIEDRG